jgi:putative addiction module component (TIGR02574 family)
MMGFAVGKIASKIFEDLVMSDKAEKLKLELANLSLEDRDGIREYLDSLEEFQSPEEREEYWVEECNRRIADLEAGRTKLVRWEDVDRRMREKYG